MKLRTFFSAVALLGAALSTHAAEKKIVLIAGNPSHGYLEHEYRAGSLLFQKCLSGIPGVNIVVASNDWPKDPSVLEGADAVVMFCTGGAGHPLAQDKTRVAAIEALVSKGAGFGTMHYGVEIPEHKGGEEFLRWQGGYFLTNCHVVSGAAECEAALTDGRSFRARLVGEDAATDIAVLRLEGNGLPHAELGRSSNLRSSVRCSGNCRRTSAVTTSGSPLRSGAYPRGATASSFATRAGLFRRCTRSCASVG